MSGRKDRPVVGVALDLRLTTDDLAALSPEQVQAVFEGVGHLTALTVSEVPELPGVPR